MEITNRGKIKLFDASGTLVSEHNEVKEAYERASNAGAGTYTIRFPDQTVEIEGSAPTEPEPPSDEPPTEEPPTEEPPPPTGDDPFAAQYAPGFKLKPLSAQAIPNVTRPPKSTGPADFIIDPVHGTHVYRICDAVNDGSKDQLRTDYSRRQATNADKSQILLIDGNGQSYAFDGITFAKIKALPLADGNCDPCWHPTNPHLLRHTAYTGGLQWYEVDVVSGEKRVLFDFAGQTPWPDATRFWTKAEGSFSADGRYICLMAQTDDYAMRGLVCVDVVEGRIVGTSSTSERPDHVSMSANGQWCVVSGAQTVAWKRDFSWSRVLYDRSEHSDCGFGPNGEDMIVHAIYSGAGDGRVGVTDMDTGDNFYLPHANLYRSPSSATSVHISTQCHDLRGWALLSTYADYGPAADPTKWPLIRRVSLHELKPDGRAFGVMDIHSDFSVGEYYFHEPQATISRDGTRVFVATSYSKPGSSPPVHAEAYMVPLPRSVYD